MADGQTKEVRMKRFNSPEHLETWKLRGRYPAIHDCIADTAATFMKGSRLLDLGCSYGLLGARIAKNAQLRCVAQSPRFGSRGDLIVGHDMPPSA